MTSHAFNQLGLPEPPPREQERPWCTPVQMLPKLHTHPPYQSLITAGSATRASSRKGRVSAAAREQREAVLAGSLGRQLPLRPPSAGRPRAGGRSCMHCPFLQEGHLVLSVQGFTCGWELLGTRVAGALKRTFCLVGTTVTISSPCGTRHFGVPWSTPAGCWASPLQQVRALSLS